VTFVPRLRQFKL